MLTAIQLVLLCLFPYVLLAESEEATGQAYLENEVRALKDQLQKESLSLREEMNSHLGDNLLLLQVIELIKEVKEIQGRLMVQAEQIENMESKLVEKVEDLESTLESNKGCEKLELKMVETITELQSGLVEKIEDQESKFMETITDLESSLGEKMGDVKSKLANDIGTLDYKVTKVDTKIKVWRSEVRLISQQKLTWQNSTFAEKLFSEYAVDGVYTGSGDLWGLNPIQHMGGNKRNYMLIVDLGGLFKVHTVKVWNRVDCCQSQSLGVMVYADEEFLGGLNDEKLLYTFRAGEDVYARKIYLKQSIPNWMNLREVQVFGTGPFAEEEVYN